MQSWSVGAADVLPHHPEVVYSGPTGRAILVNLPAGERMVEHQVHEHTWLVLTAGKLELADPDDGNLTGGPGLLIHWDPNERHEVRAIEDSRFLLLLAPWPGDGHPSERARAHPDALPEG